MGGDKQTRTEQAVTTVQRTPEEKALARQELQFARATQPARTRTALAGLELGEIFATGGELPGFLAPLGRGISPEVIREMTGEAIADITPGLQQSGLLDSGVRASIEARTSGDIRRQVAESNLNRLLSLAGVAVGAPVSTQQPIQAGISNLSQLLAGARGTTTTGTTTVQSANPFLSSFQQSLGRTLGSPTFGIGPFSFGG
jgi:hypothetical protein